MVGSVRALYVELAALGVVIETHDLDQRRGAQAGPGVAILGGGRKDLADEILALASPDELTRLGELAGIEVGLDAVEHAAWESVESGAVPVRGGWCWNGYGNRFWCGRYGALGGV